MRGCPEVIEAGRVFLLDDFTYVQVTAVTASRIRFRARTSSISPGRWLMRRGATPEAFRRRVRAEVDGAFFPVFAAGGPEGDGQP